MRLSKADCVNIFISVLLFICSYAMIPMEYGLTPRGKNFLAIFIMIVYQWMTVDTAIPSLLGLGLMGAFHVFAAKSIISLSMGAYTVGIIVAASMLINEVTEAGVLKKQAQWFVSRNVVVERPYVFFFLFALADFISGMLIGFLLSVIVFVPIALGVCESINVKKGEKLHLALMVLIIWNSSWGQIALPFNKPVNLTSIAAMSDMGYPIDYGQYAFFLVPVMLCVFVLGLLAVRFIINPDTSKFFAYEPAAIREEMKNSPFNKRQKCLTACFIALVASWLITFFKDSLFIAKYFNDIGTAVTALLMVGVLCFVQADGEPVINLNKALSRLPWKVVVFLWMVYLTSSGMSMDELGVQKFLISLLTPVFSGMHPTLILLAGLLLCSVLTNIMSDAVSVVVTLYVFVPVLSSVVGNTVNLAAFGLAVNMVSQIGYLVPAASPCCPLIIGPQISVKDGFMPTLFVTLGANAVAFLAVLAAQ